jgi:hypothetical protein
MIGLMPPPPPFVEKIQEQSFVPNSASLLDKIEIVQHVDDSLCDVSYMCPCRIRIIVYIVYNNLCACIF